MYGVKVGDVIPIMFKHSDDIVMLEIDDQASGRMYLSVVVGRGIRDGRIPTLSGFDIDWDATKANCDLLGVEVIRAPDDAEWLEIYLGSIS